MARLPNRAIVVSACAASVAACGYPTFGFAPEGDASVDAPAIDEGVDTGSDTAVDTGADTTAEAHADSVAESTTDSVVAESDAKEADADEAESDADSDASDLCALIDDLEDGDGQILVHCGRSGTWYTYNDGSAGGTQWPPTGVELKPSLIPGGRGSSTIAARTFGSGFTTFGAGMGFNFIDGGPTYDISAWGGVSFWARVETGTATSVRFGVSDIDTDPRGKICTAASKPCDDHFGVDLTFDTTWTLYAVRFSDMRQSGWGYAPASFDPKRAYGMQFQTHTGTTFDVWIDDPTFVP